MIGDLRVGLGSIGRDEDDNELSANRLWSDDERNKRWTYANVALYPVTNGISYQYRY